MAKNKKTSRTPEAPRVITARNYAAQAETELRLICENMMNGPVKRPLTKIAFGNLADIISESVHFVIPDNGTILGAERKTLYGQKVKLPFPIITIEYFTDKDHCPSGKDNKVHVSKRVVIAIENEILSKKFNTNIDIDGFCCFSMFYPDSIGKWLPQIAGGVVNTEWDNKDKMSVFCLCPEQSEDIVGNIQQLKDDILCDCGDVLELIEALNCRNVTTANHQDASPVNASRIKAGKLPIYETKMLVIDTKATETSNGGCGGYHASPRQHLRRGHIRRHPTAGNLWINSCVVGDPSKGVINKSYAVK